jgi:hypothetical protein
LARPTAGAKPYKGLFDFAASDPPDEKKRKTAPEAVVWYGSNNPKKRKNYTDFPLCRQTKFRQVKTSPPPTVAVKNRLPKRQAARRSGALKA